MGILLGIVVVSAVLSLLNSALPLPDSLERWLSLIATFSSQEVLPIEVALILAVFLIFRWCRRRNPNGLR